jgi:hypothetical protein
MPDPTTETLPDGAIRVCLDGRCGIVSSWHLVAGKVAQLEAARGNRVGTDPS